MGLHLATRNGTRNAKRLGGRVGLPIKATAGVVSVAVALLTTGCASTCPRGEGVEELRDARSSDATMLDRPIIEELEGGGSLILLERESSPTAALQLWSPRGAADEPEELPGLATVCAEWLCRRLEPPRGVELTTWASHDATVCELLAPAELAGDALTHLNQVLSGLEDAPADDGAIGRACRRARDRWRRSREDDARVAFERLLEAAFGAGHPYARPAFPAPRCEGLVEAEIAEACASWLAAEDRLIVSAGPMTARDVRARLRGASGAARPPARRHRGAYDSPSELVLDVTAEVVDLAHVSVALRLPAVEPSQLAAARLLGGVLTAGRAARLGDEVGRERLLSTLEPRLLEGRHGALLVLTATCAPESAVTASVRLASALLSLRDHAPTEVETSFARLAEAKRSRAARLSLASHARVLGLGAATQGDPLYASKVHRAVMSTSRANLSALARRWLAPEQLVISVVVPELEPHRSTPLPTTSGELSLPRVDVEALEGQIRVALDHLDQQHEPEGLEAIGDGIVRARTAGGATLLMRREEQTPAVALRLSTPLDLVDPRERSALALATLVGVLRARLEERGLEVETDGGRLSLAGTFLPGQLDRGLAVAFDALFAPPSADEVEDVSRASRDTSTERPSGWPVVAEALGIDDPSAWPSSHRETTGEALLTAVTSLHRAVTAEDRIVLTLVGALRPARAVSAIRAELAARRRPRDGEVTGRAAPAITTVAGGRTVRREVDTDGAELWLAMALLPETARHRAALQVIRALLSDEEGQAWQRLVGSGRATDLEAGLISDRRGSALTLRVETLPEREEEVADLLRRCIVALRDDALTTQELDRARRAAALRRARELSTARGRARALESELLRDGRPATVLEGAAALLRVSADELQEVAATLASEERQVVVVLGPPADEGPPPEDDDL